MRIPTRLIPPVLVVVLLTISPNSLAEVFKCVDEATGNMTFTDSACPGKGTGDYVPVAPTNADSGYPSTREIAASQRKRDQRAKARSAEWQNTAEERSKKERIAAHEKKADQLYDEADREKDLADRSSLLRQAKSEQEAASAAARGSANAEEHYKKAGEYFEKARGSKDLSGHSALTRRALAEQDAGRAAAGLPTPTRETSPSTVIDQHGKTYIHGEENLYIRAEDGKPCVSSGGVINCN
jgi:hypothetical protein